MTQLSPVQIMIAVYEEYRASYFFFLAFILVATFFLMNLFTAVVFTKYTAIHQAYEDKALVETEKHLLCAFHLLDANNSGALSKDEVLAVVGELRKVHLLPDLQVHSSPPPMYTPCIRHACTMDTCLCQ
jgi:hypothetical protein